MWRFRLELGLEGITGMPNRDMTDEEFVEASAKNDIQFPDQPGSLAKCGLWEHIDDKPQPVTATGRAARTESVPAMSGADVISDEVK